MGNTFVKKLFENFNLLIEKFGKNHVENSKILKEWNQTDKEYPAHKTIQQLFEEQVEKTPDNIAVAYQDTQLTYNELNQKANQLAHYLRQTYAIQGDDLIALCLDRSAQMLIAILAVLKSGAAYVPMDPSYPDERIIHILEDTQAKAVLANAAYGAKLEAMISTSSLRTAIELIDHTNLQNQLVTHPTNNLTQKITSQNLAYVIYTSGTTGKPKGVMIEHRGVVSLVKSTNYIKINSDDVVLQLANLAFDAATFEIYIAIFHGLKLIVLPDHLNLVADVNKLKKYLMDNEISIVWLTKTLFDQLYLSSETIFANINYLLVGGEALDYRLIKKLSASENKPTHLLNGYGPTENTTFSCTYPIKNEEIAGYSSIPIGRPLNNRTAYILDENLNLLPIGSAGELHLGGSGLARGYLNLPELTAEKFIANPFQTEEEKKSGKNARLYKTGDLVRYLPDGNIEYIGRNDFQVKIRGFRIELGEIETKLASYPEIKQTVVLAKTRQDLTGNKYLVGYYVANAPLDHESILNYLSNHLPEYMVPAALVWLDKLPLTINGKLDRNALPEPELTNRSAYVAPRNELESQVCAIYADVLGLPAEHLGIRDDFFRLGGDSIHSIQLVGRLRQNLGLSIAVKDVLIHKTIEKLYNTVLADQLSSADIALREEGILSGVANLLPIQSWFFNLVTDGLLKKSGHWNQSFLIKTVKLNSELLKQSLVKLIEYHDALRLHYRVNEKGDYQQYYHSKVTEDELELSYLNVSQMTKEQRQAILTSWQSHFELLSSNPLYKIGYLDGYADGSSRIFFAAHHLLIDTVSWRIITYDLQRLYDQLFQAQENNQLQAILQQSAKELLGRKGTSYRQWVEQVKNYQELYPAEQAYWREVMSGVELMQGCLSSRVLSEATQNHAEFTLDRESTRLLLTKCGQAYHTEINDLLLTGFGLALAQLTQSDVNYIILEGHGREEITKNIDVTRTVGWFTIMYPVKLAIDPKDITQSIIAVKEGLRKIPQKGLGYGAFMGYRLDELPRISFNYLGQLDQATDSAEVAKKYWHITGESSGIDVSTENRDNNIINVNGAVNEGELRFQVAAKLSQADLEQLVAAFKQQLIKVIQHTAMLSRSYLTVSDVDYILSQTYLDQLQAKQAISRVYLANSLQQGFIYHALNQGEEDTAYRVQLVFNYNNRLNPELLRMAWQGAIRRYPSLRLHFAWDEELVQIIDQHQDLAWQYRDISEQNSVQQQVLVDELIKNDRKKPYHLDKGHLLRAFLIKYKEDSYRFMLSSHHAILDGWSISLLFDFVHQLYLQLESSNNQQRQQLIAHIQEEETYINSQQYLQQKDLASETYWQQQLARIEDYPNLSGLLNLDQRQVHLSDYRFILDKAETGITLKDHFYDRIKAYSSEQGITVHVLLQYCWHKLLSVYGHSQTTIVGTTISGRNLPIDDIEHSVGLYINTLPLIILHDGCKTIPEELQALQTTIHEMSNHSNINLAQLQPSGRRLFDSLFVYENFPALRADKDSPIQFNAVQGIEELDYPLAIAASEQKNQIQITIIYAGELFSEATIYRLLNGLQGLLKQIMAGVEQPKELFYLDDVEYKKLIKEWNKTEKVYPAHKTIHQLFEEQVEKTPDNIAVVYEDIRFTYRELNEKSNQLAHHIKQTYLIKGDDLIVLCLDRSEKMLIAMLAILKSGAAYVPIDPGYPEERTIHILNDIQAKAVLTNEGHEEKLGDIISRNSIKTAIELIDSSENKNKLKNYPTSNPIQNITNKNLMYVIYTSGTTGKPKGVMIEHGSVINLIYYLSDKYSINSLDKILLFSNYVFDASLEQILLTMMNGSTLYICSDNIRKDVDLFTQYCIVNQVTHLDLPPIYAENIDFKKIISLNRLVLGSDYVSDKLFKKLYSQNYNLFNAYGPTETTITSLLSVNSNNIGQPVANTRTYILDSNLKPVPIGAIGELYIGGAGLARGYLNMPELTAERFIPNPFQIKEEKQAGKNARLYKTGDLVRYLPDGNIEYLGRNDFQVKIRGFRIELGEIEARLASYPGIKQTVVLAKEPENPHGFSTDKKYLIAYYVANEQLNHDAISNYLSVYLPEYMLPTALVWLDKLPLTLNGKLDRKALPDIELINVSGYVAPRNELEFRVCAVYAEVLGLTIEQVGIRDDFFRLGGNSILAIKLISRLNSQVFGDSEISSGFRINVAQLFRHKTIVNLLDTLLNGDGGDAVIIPRLHYTPEQISQGLDKIAPLSFAQERLWFIENYAGGSNAYNIPILEKLTSAVDGQSLERSLQAVISRHEVLHSLIKTDKDGSGYQEVIDLSVIPLVIKHHKLQNHDELAGLVKVKTNHIFNFENEYPIRIHWLNVENSKERYMLIVIHHIAFDGWSMDVFMRELHAYYDYYQLLSADKVNHTHFAQLNLPELTLQYKDFAVWQKNYLSGDRLANQLQYWKAKLNDYEGLHLPTDKPRPAEINYEGKTVYFNIGADISKNLRETAKKHNVSLYSVLLTGFNLLLRGYSNQDDIVIGTPIANRHHEQLAPLVGFFVNMLALRSRINPEQTLGLYIEEVGKDILDAQLNQDLPFEKLVDELVTAKDLSRHPLFQVIFSMQSLSFDGNSHELDNTLFKVQKLESDYAVAKFDLSVFVDDSLEELCGTFNYAVNLFTEETIGVLISTYLQVLEQLPDESKKIKQLSYLNAEEYKKIVRDWNKTEKEYPTYKTIQILFEEQVEKTPDNIAVIYEDTQLTYRELNQRANRLAHYLRKSYAIEGDDLIALCLDRSEQMLIAILGVLKAGAGYVPMDPECPEERMIYILSDTQAKVVLANEVYGEKLDAIISANYLQTAIELIDNSENRNEMTTCSTANLIHNITGDNLGYVIYTSGTTGKPKGVMTEHYEIVNYLLSIQEKFNVDQTDVGILVSDYIFDLGNTTVFSLLNNGATIHIVSKEQSIDHKFMVDYLSTNKIKWIKCTPIYFEFVILNSDYTIDTSLNKIILGGDQCPEKLKKYFENQKNVKVYNHYGPTETTIGCICNLDFSKGRNNIIGLPINNINVFILDNLLNPLPIGAIGELYIAGAGLARGYLNLPELTAEKFIANPFQSEEDKKASKNARLYKTGDLVRYLPDGNIEYIGRNDFQVKIRGFRIELEEIETKLASYPEVKQVVVLAKEHSDENGLPSGNKYLIGYYVANEQLNHAAILDYLSEYLPEYMIPATLVWLDKLPLTINGKLDRQALPNPEWTNASNYVAPRNDLESRVCAVYANVLGLPVERVGIRDDFFRLGGDSIHSIQLVSRLRQHLALSITVKDVFTHKTVEKLYDKVLANQLSPVDVELREEGILSGKVELLPIQSWFFSQITHELLKKPGHWNQSFLIKTGKLDRELLKYSLVKLIEYHDAFRLNYRLNPNGDYQQLYDFAVAEVELLYLDVSQIAEDKRQVTLTSWQNDFELAGTNPLYRVGYLDGYADGSCRIFFAAHHLLIDVVSWRIIMHDLQTLYGKLLHAQENNQLQEILQRSSEALLGRKGTSYRQWVEQVKAYKELYPAEKDYWREAIADESHLSSLIVNQSIQEYAEFSLDRKSTRLLLTECSHAYHTEINDLLLTGFGLALAKLTHSSAHYITLEGHGREEIIQGTDVTRTVGWFTTLYPVKLGVTPENITGSIIAVKEELRKIPHKGIGYGAILGYNVTELPRIKFNYLGQLDQTAGRADTVEKHWDITGETSGIAISAENQDSNIISANGAVNEGQLRFAVTAKLSKNDLKFLVTEFKQQLIGVIQYIASLKRGYLTTSDVDDIISQAYLDRLQAKQAVSQVYLANSLQQGFIYHALNQGEEDTAYRVQLVFNYNNHLNPELFHMAWQGAIRRYPSLRLRFAWDEELVQIIDEHQELAWQYWDISEQDSAQQEAWIDELIKTDRKNPYQLDEGHLLRVFLIKCKEDSYRFMLSSHHAILDGWSNSLLFEFVHQLYLQLENSSYQQRQQILTYIQEEEAYTNSQHYLQKNDAASEAYWHQQLDCIEDYPDLSGLLNPDQRWVHLSDYRLVTNKVETGITLQDRFYDQVKTYCSEQGVTINVLLQYCWHELLCVYGHSQTTIVGTTISGRNLPIDDIERSVGLYINTLPLIMRHEDGKTIAEELQILQTAIHEMNSHGNINLAQLQPSGRRLFDSLFIYENYPEPQATKDSPIQLIFAQGTEELDYPLAIVASEQNNQIEITIKYAGELFSEATIDQLLRGLQEILKQIMTGVEQPKALSYLDAADYKKITREWNQTEKEYCLNKTIHQLFEEQVEKTPDNIAVVYEDIRLTYSELNQRANQLANYLQETYAIQGDDLIALCLDRSEQMLIAILGVLKSGAAYVPMDPGYPEERLVHILGDTQVKAVLVNQGYGAKLSTIITSRKLPTIVEIIDSDEKKIQLGGYPEINLVQNITSQNLGYVIYTSGTTGKPKGVMIEHKSVINLIYYLSDKYSINPLDKILLFANYVFDASIEQILLTMVNGSTLYVCSSNIREDINSFTQYCIANQITHLHLTPTYAENIDFKKIVSLNRLILGGDYVSDNLFKRSSSQNYQLINEYGPTETTVTSLLSVNSNNIGQAVANTRIYILDAHLKPVPMGAIGELYIGGAGLARGYLNLPELTAEKFIANPFQSEEEKQADKNSRLYKTGDLVRYLPDGNIEYIGRNDFQVKIRGFRIELGEIETKLASYPEIKQTVVLAKEHLDPSGLPTGNKYLVGYYVANEHLNHEAILDYLSEHLPEYMIPAVLVWLDKLPLTINGKLDRQALPDPEWTSASNYVAPRNDLESQVCAVYADVLGLPVEQVGIRDDFFRLGGDSIHSIQLVSRLRQHLALNITVKDVFTHKTVEKLYNKVLADQLSPADAVLREEGMLSGDVGLLPIQSWFFNNVTCGLLKKPGHWNQSFLIKTGKLNRELLKYSLVKLIEYHDAFRLHYRLSENGDYQQFYDSAVGEVELLYLDVSRIIEDERQATLTSWQSDFELTGANSLYRIGYLDGYADGNCRIFFALHHILIDVVSWRIIAYDLQTLYDKLLCAKENNQLQAILQQSSEELLGRKGTSYRQWVEQVKAYKELYPAEKDYWREAIAGESHLSSLIVNQSTQQYAEFSLDRESTRLLLTECGHAYHTEINDLLLVGFGLALTKLTHSSTHYITLEGHGREEIIQGTDVTRTVGWFTTLYPVKLGVVPKNIAESIIAIKEELRKIPHKGIGYGAIMDYSITELPRISFNYLGQLDQASGKADTVEKHWRIMGEASGIAVSAENQDSNIINANGAVNDGELRFHVAAKLSQRDLKKLVAAFKQQLIVIIQHTASLNRSYLTVSDVDHIISQAYLDKLQEKQSISQVYLANSLQQGFIYHALNQGEEDTAYRIQLVFNYNNRLNPELFRMAWQGAIRRYPSLRLRFAWNEESVQIIDDHQELAWQYWDISEQDAAQQEAWIDKLIKTDRKNPYQLDEGHLLRVFLIKCKKDSYRFMLSSHHTILDGWSNPLLFEFVHQLYLKLENGSYQQRQQILTNIQEEEAYINSQKYLQKNDAASAAYWHQQLTQIEDYPDLTGLLNPDQRWVHLSDYRLVTDKVETGITLQDRFYDQVKTYCSEQGVTINVLLQYCWHQLLRVYGHSQTTIVGTTISGRNLPIDDIERSVGLYINTLPLIMRHEDGKTIAEELQILQTAIHEMNSHGNINLAQLQPSGRRLFDSLFIYENYPEPQAAKDGPIQLIFVQGTEELDYPLAIVASEQNNQIEITIKYAGELFSEATIDQLLRGLQEILKQIMTGVEQPKALSYLDAADYKKITREWNQTEKEYCLNKTIHQLFEEQVEKTPDNIAVVYEDIRLTYSELNQKSNQLAHYLRETYAIQGDDLIALCLDRNEKMLIAILAVLKSGAAYVPMDPGYPEERTIYILNDTQTKIVITNESYGEKIGSAIRKNHLKTEVELIDCNEKKSQLKIHPMKNLVSNIKNHHLAYVIYTSGTTGNPKGVMIEHGSVINLTQAFIKIHDLDKNIEIGLYSNYVFDAFVYEILPGLLNGNKLFLLSNEARLSIDLLVTTICDNQIKTLFIPTVLVAELASKLNTCQNSLKLIYTGGDKLSPLKNNLLNEIKLLNEYGPTESTVCATLNHYKEGDLNINIGRPIDNVTIYILDNSLNPLPIGAIGELYIGGAGLARGYLNQTELTAEKFIPNPFQSDDEKQASKNARLYKTGDLVRYLSDGNIEYIGRNDFQVKIRGFRLELGEIETKLASYPKIKQAVVLAKEYSDESGLSTGNKYLVGYYVANEQLNHDAILEYLSQRLPEYMIPAALVWLDRLPLTINGKLDRKALPDPEWASTSNYVAPRNDLESRVCAVYADVLGLPVEQIGIYDDFFRLGGNSILAIKLISRLNSQIFGDTKLNSEFRIKVAQLFQHKTIATLLESVPSEDEGEAAVIIPTLRHTRIAPLSFAQERLWFIEKYAGGSKAYNIPLFHKLTTELDNESLERSLHAIVSRHEVLHSLIKTDDEGSGYQEVIDLSVTPLIIMHHQPQDFHEMTGLVKIETNHIFSLEREYPIRIHLFNVASQKEQYILIVVHHIAFDGWSVDVFMRELHAYYDYYRLLSADEANHTHLAQLNLSELRLQYKDFSVWQKNYLSGDRLAHQLQYWKEKLSDYEGLHLPTDKPRPVKINYEGETVYFNIGPDLSKKLRDVAKKHGVSLYSVLLAGFNLLLRSYSNQDDIVIGTPTANRHHAQLESLIGFFVNTLALRSRINPEQTLGYYIEEIGKDILEAQLNQDLPFEKLVDELVIEKDLSRHPLFQVMFGVQSFGKKNHQSNNTLFEVSDLETDYAPAKFDLTVFVDDGSEELCGSFNYAVSLFAKKTIDVLITTYLLVLEQLPDESKKIKQLSYLNPVDYKKLVRDYNKTEKAYSTNKIIHQLFEEQVEKTPDNIAVVYEDIQLTYSELNQRVNQLAHYLRKTYLIQGDDLIALCLDRSEYMLIAILAVLKSGAAYVALDPGYPEERTIHILNDIQAKAVLANEVYGAKLRDIISKNRIKTAVKLIDDGEIQQQLTSFPVDNPIQNISSQNLVYIVYTSGTTGQPKGILIEHRGAVIRIITMIEKSKLGESDKYLCKTSYLFDVSFSDIFTVLGSGATLYITKHVFDILEINKLVNKYAINFCHFVPSQLETLLQERSVENIFKTLKTINVSGEGFRKELISKNADIRYLNYYGPTEAGEVTVDLAEPKSNPLNYPQLITIGRPIYETKLYILDQYLNLLPIGAIGELYVGGAGLARGYLNLPELTTERFIPNPFQSEEEKQAGNNARLYKTGDLVRYLPDGNIEYFGRNDFQVKIRGFRVELGEIETKLASYPGIKQTVVLAKEHRDQGGSPTGNKSLVGYYVANEPVDNDAILQYLSQHLPDYMIPIALVRLDKLPLTINGKLDRKALPDPEWTSASNYIAPRNDLESRICAVYAEVLGLPADQIGIHDDFFRLGGNSILAIKLISRLNSQICSDAEWRSQVEVKVAQLFRYKTISALCENFFVKKTDYQEIQRYNQTNRSGLPKLIFIHPSIAGSEVYQKLAERLSEQYDCIGIDNYNIHHQEQITTLEGIATYYLSQLTRFFELSEPIYLCGWSLGGQIALEMAHLLEKQGYSQVVVICLDAILLDEKLHKYKMQVNEAEIKESIFKQLAGQYAPDYVAKVVNAYDSEKQIWLSENHPLEKTKVILYKALYESEEPELGSENDRIKEFTRYVLSLPNNNIDKICRNVRVIPLPCHHGNIIEMLVQQCALNPAFFSKHITDP